MKKVLSIILISLASLMLFSCAEERVFEPGERTDTAYESADLGLGFALTDGWSFATDEEMSEIFGVAADILGEDAASDIESYYEFYAYNENGATVNLIVEKAGSEAYVKKNLADIVENTVEALEPELEKIYTDVELSLESISVADSEYYGYTASANIGDINAYHKGFCVPCGGYIASFSIFSLDENDLSSITDMFYAVSEQ